MTKRAQEAYIRGFCKVAEAYGVDPQELMKIAEGNRVLGDEVLQQIHQMKRMKGLSPRDISSIRGLQSGYLAKIIDNKTKPLGELYSMEHHQSLSPEIKAEIAALRKKLFDGTFGRFNNLTKVLREDIVKKGPSHVDAFNDGSLRGQGLLGSGAKNESQRMFSRMAKKSRKATSGVTSAARAVARIATRGKVG